MELKGTKTEKNLWTAPLAASPAAAAGDRFCGGGLLGDQRWGGSGAAHDLVIGGWVKVWYNNEEKIKTIIYYDKKKQPPTGFPVSGRFAI